MRLIIIGKMGVASLGAAAIAIGGFALAKFLKTTTVEIYGFISTDSAVNDAKMKCQISAEKFDCKVEEVTELTTDNNNHVLWSSFKGSTTKPLEGGWKTQKFYKINISEDVFNKQAKEWSTKPIKVVKEGGAEIASINAVFAINNSKLIEDGETKTFGNKASTTSFVGQASETVTTTSDHKCSLEKQTDFKECKIYPFVYDDGQSGQTSETDIPALTFKKTETEATETKTNNYYLITFTDSTYSPQALEQWTSKEIIYAKGDSDATAKVKFRKISAVKVVGKQLLILKESESPSN